VVSGKGMVDAAVRDANLHSTFFLFCFKFGLHGLSQVILYKDWNHTWGRNIREVEPVAAIVEVDFLFFLYCEMCITRPDT
jgi:hypothetical protein